VRHLCRYYSLSQNKLDEQVKQPGGSGGVVSAAIWGVGVFCDGFAGPRLGFCWVQGVNGAGLVVMV
jgi:hypothetical protein